MRMNASCATSSASTGPDDAHRQREHAPLEPVVERLAAAGVPATDRVDQRRIVVSGLRLWPAAACLAGAPSRSPSIAASLCGDAEHWVSWAV